jgi:hypothetical protein
MKKLMWVISATLLVGTSVAEATTYYQSYGTTLTETFNVVVGTHDFQVNGIAQYKYTEWYVNGVYQRTDDSGFWAIDPDYAYAFTASSGTIAFRAIVYNSNWTVKETHTWNITVPETVSQPSTPTGPSSGNPGSSLTFSTGGATSSKGHSVQYRFDWGDGSQSSWGSSSQSHTYSDSGLNDRTYSVTAQARCSTDTSVQSSWSGGKSVTISRAKAGQITSVSPSTFSPGVAQTVTVTVNNTGRDDANMIVDVASVPSGWSVSPSSKQTGVSYNTVNSTFFTYTVTPPSSDSSGIITWKLYYDDTWPTANTLLYTYN